MASWDIWRPASATRAINGVNLGEEDDARVLGPDNGGELTDHTCAFAGLLLDKIGANDVDESGIGTVGNGAGRERLDGAGGAV